MTQVLHLSSRWNKFPVSLLISIQSVVSVCGRISPHSFEMFSISPQQAYYFRCCFFPITPFYPSWKGALLAHLWQKLAFFFSILVFRWSIFHSFSRRHCDVALFDPSSHLLSKIMFFPFAYPFDQSVVISFKFSHLIKFCLPSQPECCLKPFLPLVPFFQ